MTEKKPPLIVVVDPAGGEDPARITRRLTEALARSGVNPDHVRIRACGDRLNWWAMPTEDIVDALVRLLNDSGTATQGGDR